MKQNGILAVALVGVLAVILLTKKTEAKEEPTEEQPEAGFTIKFE